MTGERPRPLYPCEDCGRPGSLWVIDVLDAPEHRSVFLCRRCVAARYGPNLEHRHIEEGPA